MVKARIHNPIPPRGEQPVDTSSLSLGKAHPDPKSTWDQLSRSFWLDSGLFLPHTFLGYGSQQPLSSSGRHKAPLVQTNSCTAAKSQQQNACLTIAGSSPPIHQAQACSSNCCPIMFSGCSKVKGNFVPELWVSQGCLRLAKQLLLMLGQRQGWAPHSAPQSLGKNSHLQGEGGNPGISLNVLSNVPGDALEMHPGDNIIPVPQKGKEKMLKARGNWENLAGRTAPGLQAKPGMKVHGSTVLLWLGCGDALGLFVNHPDSHSPALPQPGKSAPGPARPCNSRAKPGKKLLSCHLPEFLGPPEGPLLFVAHFPKGLPSFLPKSYRQRVNHGVLTQAGGNCSYLAKALNRSEFSGKPGQCSCRKTPH